MGYGISTLPYTNHTRGLAGPQLARPVRAPPPPLPGVGAAHQAKMGQAPI